MSWKQQQIQSDYKFKLVYSCLLDQISSAAGHDRRVDVVILDDVRLTCTTLLNTTFERWCHNKCLRIHIVERDKTRHAAMSRRAVSWPHVQVYHDDFFAVLAPLSASANVVYYFDSEQTALSREQWALLNGASGGGVVQFTKRGKKGRNVDSRVKQAWRVGVRIEEVGGYPQMMYLVVGRRRPGPRRKPRYQIEAATMRTMRRAGKRPVTHVTLKYVGYPKCYVEPCRKVGPGKVLLRSGDIILLTATAK